ncbi:MAG: ABC-F family ATP-binding cassette domain-containing protein [Ancalomicrobiaceae bacterium]|nr:ABC-F family ATP-binding cassette domain-containing protein [Ancalomicrobiaceae bacterium]
MAAPVLTLRDISLTFGGSPLLEGAELSVFDGDRIALVGRNGSGKSTLLKIAAEIVQPDKGERVVRGGATVRYLPQEPDIAGFPTTLAYVEAGLASGDDHYRAQYLLNELGLTGEEDPRTLSGGEIRRAALARALAPEPDVLLLDEPTNHLDLPAIEWLETELSSLRSALVLISHDRRFLVDLARSTVWLDRGQIRRMDRPFGEFESWRDDILEQEERDRHKLDRKIAMEEDWVRYGVSGRRRRNMRRLGELFTMRQSRKEARRVTGTVQMTLSEAEASGKLVVEAKGLAKRYGDRSIVENFSFRLTRGDRIGIVGPNGAGKTTLVRLLTGLEAPDAGSIRFGANVEMVTLDQKREGLLPTMTLKEALTGGSSDTLVVNGQSRHVVSYMKDFLFGAEQIGTPVSVLSGGERGRLMLARALAKPSNLIVLDEPTNDLDLETLDLLEELLADYPGTVILVSHDRDFLDRVVTSVVVSESERLKPGTWVDYAGGYSDMVAQRGSGVAARRADAAKPEPARAAPAAETAPKAAPAQKRKLSFKDRHALETLPGTIDALSKDLAKLEVEFADAGLYARDPQRFEHLSHAISAKRDALAKAEEDWLRLELLREEIEAG